MPGVNASTAKSDQSNSSIKVNSSFLKNDSCEKQNGKKDCKSIEKTPGKIVKKKSKNFDNLKVSTTKRLSISSEGSSSVSNLLPLPPPPPPPLANVQSLFQSDSNSCTKITFPINSVLKSPTLKCNECVSKNLIEIQLKLKSCQDCKNVIIDELIYNNMNDNCTPKTASTSTPQNTTIQSCYFHLTNITKKLKNLYKTHYRHSASSSCSSPPKKKSSITTIAEIELPNSQKEHYHVEDKSYSDYLNESIAIKLMNHSLNSNKSEDALILKINDTDKLKSSLPTSNLIQNDNEMILKNNYSKILKTEIESKISDEVNADSFHSIRGCIAECACYTCGISMANAGPLPTTSSSSTPSNHLAFLTASSSPITPACCKLKMSRGTQSSTNLLDCKINNNSNSSEGITQKSVTDRNDSKQQQRVLIVSDEFRRKAIENKQVKIGAQNQKKLNSTAVRRNLMKKIRNNVELSKSLDIISPSEFLENFDENDITKNIFQMPYVCTSKSTNNLNDIYAINEDDDNGPFESINSVELIFISDEFLNKAIKHDLKILKSCNKQQQQKFSAKLQQQQNLSKNEINNHLDNKNVMNSIKTKPPISPTADNSIVKNTLENSSSNNSNNTLTKKSKRPPKLKLDSAKNLESVRKNSISPTSGDKIRSKSVSPKSGSFSTTPPAHNPLKKLIIISEDFKRKSLENTIIIINDEDIQTEEKINIIKSAASANSIQNISLKTSKNSLSEDKTDEVKLTKNPSIEADIINNEIQAEIVESPSSSSLKISLKLSPIEKPDEKLNEVNIKRKPTMKEIKYSHQHNNSSIDDVGNHVLSHAFCSAEEPDEECLENKEIIKISQ